MVRIEIFTGPGCSFCTGAKDLLRQHGLDFSEYDVSNPAHMASFRERLPRVKSIPQIFIDGGHVGGFEDLQLLAERRGLPVA